MQWPVGSCSGQWGHAVACGVMQWPVGSRSGQWSHAVASGLMQWTGGSCSGQWVHAVASGFVQWPVVHAVAMQWPFMFSQSFVSQNTSTVGGLAIVDQRQRPQTTDTKATSRQASTQLPVDGAGSSTTQLWGTCVCAH